MDPGIDVRFAADEQELYAESVGADEKNGNEKKPEGEHGFRIMPAKDRADDRLCKNKDGRQAEERDRDRDQLDPSHKFERPGLAFTEYFAQTRKKRLGKRGERKGLTKTGEFLGDGIKSGDRIISEKPDGKNARGGISVDRDD